METAEYAELQILREMVARLAEACDDADLLDLVCRLLAQSGAA